LFYFLSTPQQPWWFIGASLLWIAYAGLNVGLPNLMLKLSRDPDRRVRYDAVYYGLSTVRNKEEKVVRRLVEMALESADPNLTQRVWWGLREDKDLTRQLLEEFQKSPDPQQASAARQAAEALAGKTPTKVPPR